MADRRLHLLVEGQTEEVVVRDVFEPYLDSMGWLVSSSILTTKRPAGGPNHHGGVTSWAKLKHEIRLLLRDTSLDVLTTLIDYYAFPSDAPGMATRPPGDSVGRAEHVECAMAAAIGDPRFLPHLTLHEMESWVFAAADQLGELYGTPELAQLLKTDSVAAGGPELVNDGVTTAPSKRLMRYRPGYMKTVDGPLAIAELGLAELRACCPHLDQWLTDLGSG